MNVRIWKADERTIAVSEAFFSLEQWRELFFCFSWWAPWPESRNILSSRGTFWAAGWLIHIICIIAGWLIHRTSDYLAQFGVHISSQQYSRLLSYESHVSHSWLANGSDESLCGTFMGRLLANMWVTFSHVHFNLFCHTKHAQIFSDWCPHQLTNSLIIVNQWSKMTVWQQ